MVVEMFRKTDSAYRLENGIVSVYTNLLYRLDGFGAIHAIVNGLNHWLGRDHLASKIATVKTLHGFLAPIDGVELEVNLGGGLI